VPFEAELGKNKTTPSTDKETVLSLTTHTTRRKYLSFQKISIGLLGSLSVPKEREITTDTLY